MSLLLKTNISAITNRRNIVKHCTHIYSDHLSIYSRSYVVSGALLNKDIGKSGVFSTKSSQNKNSQIVELVVPNRNFSYQHLNNISLYLSRNKACYYSTKSDSQLQKSKKDGAVSTNVTEKGESEILSYATYLQKFNTLLSYFCLFR